MGIRAKIILVVLPLIITTLLLTGASSFFSATNAITGVAKEFLGFKAVELEKYAAGQWGLLVENNFTENPAMVAATQAAIESYAASIVRSPTEVIFALDAQGELAMQTGELEVRPGEKAALAALAAGRKRELATPRIGGADRVVKGFWFEPFGWYLVVSEQRATFYSRVSQITTRTLYILGGAILAGVVLIMLFANYLTRPLTKVVGTMEKIIRTGDLSNRVAVEYHDEIGKLAHTFNLMVGQLEKAYNDIKRYAFKAALAKNREYKIRNIFQKYVPGEVIDQFFKNPEAMLVGDNRVLSVLFSDIRSFTSISEKMAPDDLVSNLNRYFSVMVKIIQERKGTVDKYIGDAIMAFFGAPVKHEDDALQSVLAGIEMDEALASFNANQASLGKPEWRIGIGINYGVVTVGNIGTDTKMNYTIIGDMVNLASRLEGLTKEYRQPLLISEGLRTRVGDKVPFRLIDSVAVKGKKQGVKIYTARRKLNDAESEAWALHNGAMEMYYHRDFQAAAESFQKVAHILPQDYAAGLLEGRCRNFLQNPPAKDWDGVTVMEHK
ncbi:MAG: adenylate cyclase [Spirochaetes bacterium GWB1_66_5]|nr:MAG: adenylate cyclase [Spirochaetes bacterium GWB1_66_5]